MSSVCDRMVLPDSPLLIVVLNGDKELGLDKEVSCHSGQFIFLSDSPSVNMRNIPQSQAYFALLIEFNYEDFSDIPSNNGDTPKFLIAIRA